MEDKIKVLIFIIGCVSNSLALPSMVVSTTESSRDGWYPTPAASEDRPLASPQIYEMNLHTNVSNRFAKTLVTSKVKNPAIIPQQITFSVILPDSAFISEFVMEIGGKSYKAYVKEKEEAKQIYDQAVASGRSAAHVAVNARDSNRFTVSVNVEPEEKAVFFLTYEELLQRKNEMYEVVINIHPGQIVKALGIQVDINESRPLKFVKTPALRSGNEISKNANNLEPNTDINLVNETSAVVTFKPDIDQQKRFAENLGTDKENGLSGQFVVQYDVDRDPQGGEILIKDGYFVHFFAPEHLEPLAKQVVFVLDTSGSMYDGKLDQVKKAMESILTELKVNDVFNIVDFDDSVRIWNIENSDKEEIVASYSYEPLAKKLEEADLPGITSATPENIEKAKKVVSELGLGGSTNIIGSLQAAIYLVRKVQQANPDKYQPLIIFLTDGEANVGLWNGDDIIKEVAKINTENKIPIFSLSFGEGADKEFLRKLSLKNLGFSRHIYHASDAYLQLQDFYRQISSPLLNNVTFEYVDPNVEQVTKKHFPIYFRGGELVVAGRYTGGDIDPGFSPHVWGNGWNKVIDLKPQQETSAGSLERLWAYLTIKQKLEAKDAAEDKEALEKEALDLALKYSFVTPVSSLVVVKPNETSSIDTEKASGRRYENSLRSDSGNSYPLLAAQRGGPRPILLSSASGGYASSGSQVSARRGLTTFGKGTYLRGPPLYTTPRVVATSEHTISTSTVNSIMTLEDLKLRLPWLADVLDATQNLSINGTSYSLGVGANLTAFPECSNTPTNNVGHCLLLHQCDKVFTELDTFEKYEEHFCPLQGFAGVCCPTA